MQNIVNYYEVLGVKFSATTEEIKSAYRKLVRRYHPDTGSPIASNDIFQSIQQAYDILTNVKKRKEYDQKIEKNTEIHSSSKQVTKKGWRSYFLFRRKKLNPFVGRYLTVKKIITKPKITTQFTISVIESLRGTVREFALDNRSNNEVIKVNIPAGVENGTLIQIQLFDLKSKKNKSIPAKINVEADPLLDRYGNDLILKIPITVGEALNGTEVLVPTLDKSIKVKIPPISQPNFRIKIKGEGIIAKSKRGDLYVAPYIVSPNTENDSAKLAAQAIDAYYTDDIRKDIPKTLLK